MGVVGDGSYIFMHNMPAKSILCNLEDFLSPNKRQSVGNPSILRIPVKSLGVLCAAG
jgi:hypothetical protein